MSEMERRFEIPPGAITVRVDRSGSYIQLDEKCEMAECRSGPKPDPKCPKCMGIGYTLTEAGLAIYHLMIRHR
jgi:hypothetical protein